MSLKRTIHELCPRCGERQVTIRGRDSRIWYLRCKCEGVPGPPSPPVEYRRDEVIVVGAADFIRLAELAYEDPYSSDVVHDLAAKLIGRPSLSHGRSESEADETITGTYRGRWSAWVFTCEIGGTEFQFKTPEGIRGINVPAIAQVFNGEVVVIKAESEADDV